MDAEQLTAAVADHAEGPVWDATRGTVRWVDMLAGDLLSLDLGPDRSLGAGGVHRRHVDDVAAVLRPRIGGGTVVAGESAFLLLDRDDAVERRITVPGWPTGTRMNEGGCDPAGAFYAGSMAYDARPGAGRLYRLAPSGEITVVLAKVTISNGLAWSPDGTGAYYVDTATGRIDVLDADLGRRRPFVTIPPEHGSPDGITVDATGAVWVALWGGGAVHRYTAGGLLDGVVHVPVRQVTACTFGGPTLDELFITTSRHGLADPEPGAGALFRAAVGVTGLPPLPYAG
ncbi:SMP-30/gluconolactonase/LRE family protein [Dactylosporangium aurantiacum]|uniref:SMP-30/gluconolactonase/LRE family protein n=1 Tax=Dactylosporangium aurantiacum TaxID=35754 RepID=A0A9Q9IRS4_9ACTN|nr:SMP-30/gluconolactonase/LRE family protein [Dactylosporangium aurantiacum]MDG6107661.1 SMP-30/gluconolactonase/LRE family protein [Dactylosporangium aurantiacum]UWZ58745.1 SMP-30/gluconolactonase/LRE family protein [Dactylosporangium aurantiacum]